MRIELSALFGMDYSEDMVKDAHVGDGVFKQKLTASIWQEDEWFVAQCVEVDVASQGKTEDEALNHLRDALELHFTPPLATIASQFRSLDVEAFPPSA
jgi:hypothetical protein